MGSREEAKVKDGKVLRAPGLPRWGWEEWSGEGGRFLESQAGRDPVTQAFISPKHPTAPCDPAWPEKGEARRAQNFSRSTKLVGGGLSRAGGQSQRGPRRRGGREGGGKEEVEETARPVGAERALCEGRLPQRTRQVSQGEGTTIQTGERLGDPQERRRRGGEVGRRGVGRGA